MRDGWKLLIDGYIIKVDYTEQKKLAAAVSRAARNINYICRRMNSTGHFYADDVADLKACQGWNKANKCHTPKEVYFPDGMDFGGIKTHATQCRCAKEQREKEEQERIACVTAMQNFGSLYAYRF